MLEEALRAGVDTIVAYHPPIFDPLSELTPSDQRQRVILSLVESKIAVYSPHTALDSVAGGVNDWLAGGIGEHLRIPGEAGETCERGEQREEPGADGRHA